jgi:hypothetical protein
LKVNNGQGERWQPTSRDAVAQQLREVLQRLTSASALISILIKNELTGSKDRARLERLYSAKGGVTCAIEETQKRLSMCEC